MTRRVVLVSESPDHLPVLQALVPDDCKVVRYDRLPSKDKDDVPALVILDVTTLDATVESFPPAVETPLLVWLPDTAAVSRLNQLLPDARLTGVLTSPLDAQVNRDLIARALDTPVESTTSQHLRQDLMDANELLNRRLQALNTLYTVGKFIVSTLDHDEVLERILDVALNITQAEEGFILLSEESKLFLRAEKNVEDEIVERFHKEATDSVAWRVIRSGRPVMLQRDTKIATGYMAHTLLYVPLQAPGEGPFGVVAVFNRTQDKRFNEEQLFTLSSIADFAAITLKNARLFETVEVERSRLRAIMEGATEIILIADERGRLLLWSETARQLFDIPPEAQGQPIWEVITHPDLLELFEDATEGKRNLHAEITLNESQVFNTQLSYALGLGGVVIMQDITHLKELDRLKSEFVSMVSHDLRTPLTTIQGYVALLERAGPLNEMQTQFVGKTLNSLTYITELITDLLDIGRIEAGYDLDMKHLRFDSLVRDTCSEMVAQAEGADITLHCACEDKTFWVKGSTSRLRQVLENLIGNAIKYNRPGGWVRVTAQDNNGCVIVSIRDNGLGISGEEQAKIFERFYRVQRPETSEIQGTGLGLAIVKSVVDRHNGRVWVESELGVGSTFSFILPLLPPEEIDATS